MNNICTNINDNPWGYVVKNNILGFLSGPLSQWFGGYANQNYPFKMSVSDCTSIYHGDGYIRFLDRYDQPHNEYFITFNTAEQAMMFGKAILFQDFDIADKILETKDPRIQKQLGRAIKNYVEEEWAEIRLDWVTQLNCAKFSQHEDLKNFLVNTCKNYILCEASPVDRIWGIGYTTKDEETFNVTSWKGQNLLGRALMRVREKLSI
jgi:ribA/ribD-fused uncharacterized protein